MTDGEADVLINEYRDHLGKYFCEIYLYTGMIYFPGIKKDDLLTKLSYIDRKDKSKIQSQIDINTNIINLYGVAASDKVLPLFSDESLVKPFESKGFQWLLKLSDIRALKVMGENMKNAGEDFSSESIVMNMYNEVINELEELHDTNLDEYLDICIDINILHRHYYVQLLREIQERSKVNSLLEENIRKKYNVNVLESVFAVKGLFFNHQVLTDFEGKRPFDENELDRYVSRYREYITKLQHARELNN